MKTTLTLATLALTVSAMAHVDIVATRLTPNSFAYAMRNVDWGQPNQAPMYFSVPIGDGAKLNLAGSASPPGFEIYGGFLPNSSEVSDFAFAAHENSSLLQMPSVGAYATGFVVATDVPTVLETTECLYGIGDFVTNQTVHHGRVLGPMPVAGTVQGIGEVTLEDYVGVERSHRSGFLVFQPVLGGEPFVTIAGVDDRSWLLCAGPEDPGSYELTLIFPGYLQKKVAVTVANGECNFTASLIPGDADGDNEVGPGDFGMLAAAFLSVPGDSNWEPFIDLDGDGEVGPGDFAILANNFLLSGD